MHLNFLKKSSLLPVWIDGEDGDREESHTTTNFNFMQIQSIKVFQNLVKRILF